jgi:hypothetical protein
MTRKRTNARGSRSGRASGRRRGRERRRIDGQAVGIDELERNTSVLLRNRGQGAGRSAIPRFGRVRGDRDATVWRTSGSMDATRLQILESRRTNYESLQWQSPALTFAAQAFLLTILSDDSVGWWVATPIALAGALACFAAFVSLAQLRHTERLHGEAVRRLVSGNLNRKASEREQDRHRPFGHTPVGARFFRSSASMASGSRRRTTTTARGSSRRSANKAWRESSLKVLLRHTSQGTAGGSKSRTGATGGSGGNASSRIAAARITRAIRAGPRNRCVFRAARCTGVRREH